MEPLLGPCDAERPDPAHPRIDAGLPADPLIDPDVDPCKLGQRVRATDLRHQPSGVPGRAVRESTAFDQDDIRLACERQVVGDRGTGDPAPDDHDPGTRRQWTRRQSRGDVEVAIREVLRGRHLGPSLPIAVPRDPIRPSTLHRPPNEADRGLSFDDAHRLRGRSRRSGAEGRPAPSLARCRAGPCVHRPRGRWVGP